MRIVVRVTTKLWNVEIRQREYIGNTNISCMMKNEPLKKQISRDEARPSSAPYLNTLNLDISSL